MRLKTGVLVVLVIMWVACKKATESAKDYSVFEGFVAPSHFPTPVYNLEGNPITQEKFYLGKRLFYDPILSINNTISCGSCHIPTSAFTQHGHSVSHGVEDRLGRRNSPPIMNLVWHTSFMWDGGIKDLDLQPIAPITAHEEMAETMQNVLKKLNESSSYKAAFKKAYGADEITSTLFLKSLTQFMIMCISANAKYDSVINGYASFTSQETAGYKVYKEKCKSCHVEPLFTDFTFRNNGLRPSAVDDKGRFDITLKPQDVYSFKVPSLRNLRYTAPYMHDGRYLTLEAVLNHYTNNVHPFENLDMLLMTNTKPGIDLTSEEKKDLLAFLNTLNDASFVTNKLLAE